MKTIGLLVLGAALVLPIWRHPTWEGGKSGIEGLFWLLSQPNEEHITVEEALARARAAYLLSHPG